MQVPILQRMCYNNDMNPERKKHLRSVKVIFSECVMVVAVVIMVIILGFLVSGYWINSDFEVDRQGLLQLSSIPTGATVTIDGVEGSWIERTNMSKNLSSGEHTIILSRDGYDTWTKTINITEGLLYRIHYPRLFLMERTKEKMLDIVDFSAATISPDHSYLILMNDTTEWTTINLNDENLKPVKVDIAKYFSGLEPASSTDATTTDATKRLFTGTIEDIRWDRDSTHALFKAKFGDSIEWVLMDVKNPTNSINITREFGVNFSEVEILDNSSGNLLVVQNGNLQKVDLGAKAISNVLVENVVDFDHFNQNEVIFSAKNNNPVEGELEYYVGTFKIGDAQIQKLLDTNTPAKVTLSKFYEDKFITILENDSLTVYKKDDFEKLSDFKLNFTPGNLVVGHNGEFITMEALPQIATLDMESMSVAEWTIDGDDCDWLDNDMLYSVKDGDLIVYDYDGLNRRVIASNVSSRFPAAITDDKWLYYFSDGQLVREWLIER